MKKIAFYFAAILLAGFMNSCNESDENKEETVSMNGTWTFSNAKVETDNPAVNLGVDLLLQGTDFYTQYSSEISPNQSLTFDESNGTVVYTKASSVTFNYKLEGNNLSISDILTNETRFTGTVNGNTLTMKAYDVSNYMQGVNLGGTVSSAWIVITFTKN